MIYAAFCIGLSQRCERLLVSYVAYYVLLGGVAGWCLVVGLWPSGTSEVFRLALLTAVPLACLGMAVTLQFGPPRTAFDTGAMVGCYLYPALMAGVTLVR